MDMLLDSWKGTYLPEAHFFQFDVGVNWDNGIGAHMCS